MSESYGWRTTGSAGAGIEAATRRSPPRVPSECGNTGFDFRTGTFPEERADLPEGRVHRPEAVAIPNPAFLSDSARRSGVRDRVNADERRVATGRFGDFRAFRDRPVVMAGLDRVYLGFILCLSKDSLTFVQIQKLLPTFSPP